jgi:hypothetical protein
MFIKSDFKSNSHNPQPAKKITVSALVKIPIEFEIELLGIPEDENEVINYPTVNPQSIETGEISISSLKSEKNEKMTTEKITILENKNKKEFVDSQFLFEEEFHKISETISENISEKIVDNFLENPQLISTIVKTLSRHNTDNNQSENNNHKVSFWLNKS